MPLGLAVQCPMTVREAQVPSPEERVFAIFLIKTWTFLIRKVIQFYHLPGTRFKDPKYAHPKIKNIK